MTIMPALTSDLAIAAAVLEADETHLLSANGMWPVDAAETATLAEHMTSDHGWDLLPGEDTDPTLLYAAHNVAHIKLLRESRKLFDALLSEAS